MTVDFNRADASYYYHESAAAEIARFDSSAMCGNLADCMKNAVVLFPLPQMLPIARLAKIEAIGPAPNIVSGNCAHSQG